MQLTGKKMFLMQFGKKMLLTRLKAVKLSKTSHNVTCAGSIVTHAGAVASMLQLQIGGVTSH